MTARTAGIRMMKELEMKFILELTLGSFGFTILLKAFLADIPFTTLEKNTKTAILS